MFKSRKQNNGGGGGGGGTIGQPVIGGTPNEALFVDQYGNLQDIGVVSGVNIQVNDPGNYIKANAGTITLNATNGVSVYGTYFYSGAKHNYIYGESTNINNTGNITLNSSAGNVYLDAGGTGATLNLNANTGTINGFAEYVNLTATNIMTLNGAGGVLNIQAGLTGDINLTSKKTYLNSYDTYVNTGATGKFQVESYNSSINATNTLTLNSPASYIPTIAPVSGTYVMTVNSTGLVGSLASPPASIEIGSPVGGATYGYNLFVDDSGNLADKDPTSGAHTRTGADVVSMYSGSGTINGVFGNYAYMYSPSENLIYGAATKINNANTITLNSNRQAIFLNAGAPRIIPALPGQSLYLYANDKIALYASKKIDLYSATDKVLLRAPNSEVYLEGNGGSFLSIDNNIGLQSYGNYINLNNNFGGLNIQYGVTLNNNSSAGITISETGGGNIQLYSAMSNIYGTTVNGNITLNAGGINKTMLTEGYYNSVQGKYVTVNGTGSVEVTSHNTLTLNGNNSADITGAKLYLNSVNNYIPGLAPAVPTNTYALTVGVGGKIGSEAFPPITVGSPIGSSTPNELLFADAANNLAQTSRMSYIQSGANQGLMMRSPNNFGLYVYDNSGYTELTAQSTLKLSTAGNSYSYGNSVILNAATQLSLYSSDNMFVDAPTTQFVGTNMYLQNTYTHVTGTALDLDSTYVYVSSVSTGSSINVVTTNAAGLLGKGMPVAAIPTTIKSNFLTGQTAGVTGVISGTSPAVTQQYQLNAQLNINTESAANSVQVQFTYTDQNSVVQTLDLTTPIIAIGVVYIPPQTLIIEAGTTFSLDVIVTGIPTGLNYDVGGALLQLPNV